MRSSQAFLRLAEVENFIVDSSNNPGLSAVHRLPILEHGDQFIPAADIYEYLMTVCLVAPACAPTHTAEGSRIQY